MMSLLTYKFGEVAMYTHVITELSENSISTLNNILVMPDGTLAPRTKDNLEELIKYVTTRYKKDYRDKLTNAYKYMKSHDSELD